ncbi:MAG: HlyD family type I secretion periplasmic adaptor subunit [Alphaproteobacteria bacterium]
MMKLKKTASPPHHNQPRQESPLEQLIARNRSGKFRVNLWAISIMVIGLLVVAHFSSLDEVAIATGEVVPQEQLKVVQHLEGGIVETIMVEEGDIVSQNQVVMQLNLGASAVNENEILAAIDGFTLTRTRLEAEINTQRQPVFDPERAARRPDLVASELSVFRARQQELSSRVAVTNQRISQKKLEIDELLAHQNSLKQDFTLAEERFEMSGTLAEQGLVPRMEHLSLEAEVSRMRGELTVMQSSLPRAEAAYNEAKAQLEEERQAFKRRAIEELGEVRRRLVQLNESLQTASEQAGRADIRAPIDGIVKTLRYNTIGGVVKPGDPILDIVPISDELVIRAKLDPKDRGYVVEGLRANVKISTFDFARYGDLEGVVERIAASTDTTPEGLPFYTVVVKTDKNYLGETKGEYAIQPGMQAVVDIHTGTRTVLDYIIRPVLKLRHEAFRER